MKELREEDTIFKSLERYNGLKKRFNKKDLAYWFERIYRHPSQIGSVSALFKKFKPSSLENAYDLYVLSGTLDKDLSPKERGRTKEEIEDMAIDWKTKSGIDLPLVDFYDTIVLHAVVETCFGNIMEREAADVYRQLGFSVAESDGDDDRECGVDFIAQKEGKRFLVQVKPLSFFRGTKNEGLINDRKTTWIKQEKGLQKYPSSFYTYMIYDSDGKWLKKEGKFNFIYKDLVDRDGKPIVNIDGEEYTHEKIMS